ncbi:tRNA dimethylallyltransferase-like [Patiria miniata]|uniref:Uncharacterized protein n=1 Tax=Patiria miniata TaxID=46514 RepID=A0A914A150_PATMI|nr:tRNA dimethylallyltransferase-like [Patiria miniata]
MAAPMTSVFRRLPVVVVLGATGTGKSKLAIQIGKRLGGEIISADSMQVYKGLDIITNKVTAQEQQACPHHLIDFLNPLSRYTVVDFRNKALPVIEGLLKEGRVPVIVGGTNYYIEALLWKVLLDTEHSKMEDLLLEARGDPITLHIRKNRKHSDMNHATNKEQDQNPVAASSSGIISDPSAAENTTRTSDFDDLDDSNTSCGSTGKGSNPDLSSSGIGKGKPDTAPGLELSKPEERIRTETETPRRQAAIAHCSQQVTGMDWQSFDKTGKESSPKESSQPDRGLDLYDATNEFVNALDTSQDNDVLENEESITIKVEGTATEDLYKILAEVDPCRAETLHPNNRRKIIRSLQVYEQLGRTHSEVLSGQMEEDGGGPLGGPLRFEDVCILWLQCDRDVLDRRLDERVDDMLCRGLLKELADFHHEYNRKRVESQADSETLYTQGIFQSIGFKEFHPYLILPEDDRETEGAQSLLKEGIEKLKIATRQYARRQTRWIKNRFVRRPGSNVPPVYAVDSTDPASWHEKVLQPALDILDAILEGKEPPVAPLVHEGGSPSDEASARHVCDICEGRVFVGKQQWLGHLKSRRHYKKSRKLRLASLMKSYEEQKTSSTETTNTQRQDTNQDVEDR